MVVFCADMTANSGLKTWALLALAIVAGCQTPKRSPALVEVEFWGGWQFQDTSQVWRPAEVPGSIHADLQRHALISDPFGEMEELALSWVEDQDWRYRCQVPAHPDGSSGWEVLFEGLDTYASVVFRGDTVMRTDNMHRSWQLALPGDAVGDTLELVLHSPVRRGQAQLDRSPWPIPASNEARPIGRQTSAVTRKAMYHFGWDWGPRLVTSGIWKPVRWVRPADALPDFRWELQESSGDSVRYALIFDGPVPELELDLTLRDSVVDVVVERSSDMRFEVVWSGPEWWWPMGMGSQPLYDLTWADPQGRIGTHRFGIRTIEWVRALDQYGRSFRCVVNGKDVHLRGANVIPPDYFPVQSRERLTEMVGHAVAANMNMLRIWGGGVYGDEELYDLCDSHGILVWQDFMSACAMVPGDAGWKQNFLAEAEESIRRLRNRTSLALWCGNNESEHAWRAWGWQDLYGLHGMDSAEVRNAYAAVFEEALPRLTDDLNGGFYWPSSPHADPFESREGGSEAWCSGDQHDWGVWFGTADFDYYSKESGRFASEYGLQSVPSRKTLAAVGVRQFEDSVLQFRQRCTMDWLEPGFDGWDMMRYYAGRYFAPPDSTRAAGMDRLDRWIHLTQLTQAEGLRQALERHRCASQKTAGSLYWQLDDVWPTVSWSTVDHAGRWKLAHYAVRHANQPVRMMWDRSSEEQVRLVAQNLGSLPVLGEASWVILNGGGDTLSSGKVDLKVSAQLGVVEVTVEPLKEEQAILAWSWTSYEGVSLDSGAVALDRPAAMDWLPVEVRCTPAVGGVWLQSEAPVCGVQLTAETEGRFEDNGFILLPGKPHWVGFQAPDGSSVRPDQVEVAHLGQYSKAGFGPL